MFTAMWELIGIAISFLAGLLVPYASLRDRIENWPVTIFVGALAVPMVIGGIVFLWILIGTPIQWAIDTFGN